MLVNLDMTMCASEGCPIQDTCLRHTGITKVGIHSFALFEPVCNFESTYEFKIDIDVEDSTNKNKRFWERG